MGSSTAQISESFDARVRSAAAQADSLVCVGLDPDFDRFPAHLRELGVKDAIVRFNQAIISATGDLVCAYKPNLGFYMAYGLDGIEALLATRAAIPAHIPVILDCKTGDVGVTAAAYARGIFDVWNFDAATVNPFLGEDSLAPFFSYPNRGVLVLCKTSNPGGGEWQDIEIGDGARKPLFVELAGRINRWAKDYPASIGLVFGATYPDQLALARERCPSLPILLPGVGAQAGDVEAAVRNGVDATGGGLLVSASRSILYAGGGADFADRAREATLKLRDLANSARPSKSGAAA